MAVHIYIPLDPHLVKYLEKEAMRRNGTYKAIKTSFFGVHILGALEPMPDGVNPGPPKCSHVRFDFTERYTKGRGNWINPENTELIASWIRRDYQKEFMLFVREQHIKWGLSYMAAIEKWRERYGITENMRKLESDMRYFRRKKNVQNSSAL